LPTGFEVEKQVSFNAVGDLMNAAGTENSADIFYRQISHLVFDAELSFANLESTMTSGIPRDPGQLADLPGSTQLKSNTMRLKAIKDNSTRLYKQQITIFWTAAWMDSIPLMTLWKITISITSELTVSNRTITKAEFLT
jgi:hypothetical protein